MIAATAALDSLEALLAEGGGEAAIGQRHRAGGVEDPSAAVLASRLAGDRWFCWEQPDRDGFALAALGSACEVVSRGPGRFGDLVDACADVARGRLSDEPERLPAGAGPVWVGGFAFGPDGGSAPQWSSFPPALMVLPELALHRSAGRTHLTLCALAGPGVDPGASSRRLNARLARLARCRCRSPTPTRRARPGLPACLRRSASRSRWPRRWSESAPAGWRRWCSRGRWWWKRLGPTSRRPSTARLRELFASCFCFCCGSPEAAFLGASPELLVRRSGAGAATVALAGSARRSADPAVDDHLGEQLLRSPKDRREHDIVVRRIERALRRQAVWVEAAPEPGLVKVANIQHLATPIRAQLSEPRSAVELAGLLHPTPAVGGEPRGRALATIAELEELDRGWYAGPVGWMDAAEDGEFCVAIRSALLRDRTAHLFAGNGIVIDSDPDAELAETEVKLGALLPLLSG